jgi:hypothetical protein
VWCAMSRFSSSASIMPRFSGIVHWMLSRDRGFLTFDWEGIFGLCPNILLLLPSTTSHTESLGVVIDRGRSTPKLQNNLSLFTSYTSLRWACRLPPLGSLDARRSSARRSSPYPKTFKEPRGFGR